MKICELCPYEEHSIGNGQKAIICPGIETKFMYFNNETGNISTDDAVFIYGER
jgi:hypothetical protein